jgi:taurine dioxygenase
MVNSAPIRRRSAQLQICAQSGNMKPDSSCEFKRFQAKLGANAMEQTSPVVASALPSGALRVRPLSNALGAEIIGVDLREKFTEALSAQILDTWHRHLVILFREQNLSEEDQVRFGEQFGTLAKVRNYQARKMHPGVMLVTNIREDGKPIGLLPDGEMQFHTDQCYLEQPAKASMLYALEVPSRGGNTLFANGYLAYETLPDDVKRRIAGHKALNAYDYNEAATIRGATINPDAPTYAHPVVRTHPATGRKALYVNRLMTRYIEDMPAGESEQLLELLFAHQEQPQFVYEHIWRPGDLLMWDNRCALHARTDFSPDERRLMRRVTVLGERPM